MTVIVRGYSTECLGKMKTGVSAIVTDWSQQDFSAFASVVHNLIDFLPLTKIATVYWYINNLWCICWNVIPVIQRDPVL